MKADKNNFQFQHDFSKESYELIKILFPKALEKGFAYGMIDGKKFMNTHAFHPHIPIVTPSEALALLQPTSSEKWDPEVGEDIKNAVAVLTQALKNDPAFYYAYQANIAMAFQDEMYRSGLTEAIEVSRTLINKMRKYDGKEAYPDNANLVHAVSNDAAKAFLDLLCKDISIEPVKSLRTELTLLLWGIGKTYDADDVVDKILALIEQRRGKG